MHVVWVLESVSRKMGYADRPWMSVANYPASALNITRPLGFLLKCVCVYYFVYGYNSPAEMHLRL